MHDLGLDTVGALHEACFDHPFVLLHQGHMGAELVEVVELGLLGAVTILAPDDGPILLRSVPGPLPATLYRCESPPAGIGLVLPDLHRSSEAVGAHVAQRESHQVGIALLLLPHVEPDCMCLSTIHLRSMPVNHIIVRYP